MTCFDILNIEYNEEGYLLDFNLPDTMRICVKEGDNWSHTEEAIRKQINNMEELYANDVKVVDFTAFYEGTDKPLRGNYEDYDTHGEYAFMQAEQKKLHPGLYRYKGKIGLRKGWTECQECDDLVKLNDINWYYLKGYGQATVCDSCVGKYNYKKDRLSKGHRHGELAILQFMEQDRKEAETFNAEEPVHEAYKYKGNDLILEQPNNFFFGDEWVLYSWGQGVDEYGNHYEVKPPYYVFIESYKTKEEAIKANPTAKVLEAESFGAEGIPVCEMNDCDSNEICEHCEDEGHFYCWECCARDSQVHWNVEFNEWADQEMMTHGKDISFKDWAEDEGMKHGNVPITEWAQHEEESHDARYGAESETVTSLPKDYIPTQKELDELNEAWENGDLHFCDESITYDEENGIYLCDECGREGEDMVFIDTYYDNFNMKKKPSRSLEYDAEEEEEIWEDEDYYNIEGEDYWDRVEGMYEDFCEDWEDNPDNDGQECPSMDEWVETYGNFMAEGFRTMGGRGFHIEFKNGYTISVMFGDTNYGDHYNDLDFDYEDSKEYLESSQAELAIRKPNGEIMGDILGWVSPDFVAALIPVVATGDEAEMIEVIQNREHRDAEEWNWGGDPEGQLATAIRKARIKAKEPKKPLKIEKLDAEEGGFFQLEVKYKMEDGWEHHSDYDNEEDATGAYYDIYLKYPEVVLLEVDSEGDSDVLYRQRNYDVQGADTLGYSYDSPPDEENETLVEWYDEYLKDEEWKDMGLTDPESFEDYSTRILKEYGEMDDWFKELNIFGRHHPQESHEEYIERIEKEGMAKEEEEIKALMKEKGISYEEAQEMKYERDMEEYTHRHPWSAETSGQWEIGEQLEEAQMNAEEGTVFEASKWAGYCPTCNKWRTTDMSVRVNKDRNVSWSMPDKLYGKLLCKKWQRGGKIHQQTSSWTGYGQRFHDDSYCGTPLTKVKNAEDKKRKKISGVLSDPFDELSLDSGGIKKWLAVGIIGALTVFGYTKWK